jgi:hypothetical protein
MELDRNTLRQMIWDVVTLNEDELNCQQCFEHLDHFAELSLVGKSATDAMPLVEHHLKLCTHCREEFEALLVALQEIEGPAIAS